MAKDTKKDVTKDEAQGQAPEQESQAPEQESQAVAGAKGNTELAQSSSSVPAGSTRQRMTPGSPAFPPRPLIYIGPDVQMLGLYRNTVYKRGQAAPEIEAAIQDVPEVRALLVPTPKLLAARAELRTPGSRRQQAFEAVLRHKQRLLEEQRKGGRK